MGQKQLQIIHGYAKCHGKSEIAQEAFFSFSDGEDDFS
jgi:hypothetical protein